MKDYRLINKVLKFGFVLSGSAGIKHRCYAQFNGNAVIELT